MEMIFSSILFGVFGGLVRVMVGIAKYLEKNRKNQKIRWQYLAFTIGVAALVGGVAGAIADNDWRFAIIAGYAGSDFLEGLYKIKQKQGFEI